MEKIAIIILNIYVQGEHVGEVGPFMHQFDCTRHIETIMKPDYRYSFDKHTPYGQVTDKWGIGGGAIMRLSDYSFTCDRQEKANS